MSRMMIEMIEHFLASQPDLTIAVRISGAAGLCSPKLRNVDVVISGTPAEASSGKEMNPLCRQRPRKLLTIGQDGKRGVMCVLRPHRTVIDELSADSLIAAIRAQP